MALFGLARKGPETPKIPPDALPSDPKWVRNRRGKYHRLIHLDTKSEGLEGLSGVYVIWHSGVAPRWVWVGRADDLAAAIDAIHDEDDIMFYEKHGGLYVTWAPVRPEYQPGVVRYLTEQMKPVCENDNAKGIKADAVPVFVPGAKGKTATKRPTAPQVDDGRAST